MIERENFRFYFPLTTGILLSLRLTGVLWLVRLVARCHATMLPDEATYICDSCGEEIVIPLDLSAGARQQYVEDCPVCCRPNVVHVEIDEGREVRAWAEPEQDYE